MGVELRRLHPTNNGPDVATPRSGSGAMRLLVVEDELRIVEIVTSALRKAGFTVDAATTSADHPL
jgi:hypothetical protein